MTYWKNGTPFPLGADDENRTSSGIAIHGSDVYVIGWRSSATRGAINCCWKNGVLFNLGDSTGLTGNAPPALFISGADVYAVWTEMDAPQRNKTFYSKNLGKPVPIIDGSADVSGCAIAVRGKDVYVAGSGSATDPDLMAAKYWKNGSERRLSDGPRHSAALGIALDGTDVYTCGWIRTATATVSPLYWKNGTAIKLGDSTTYGFARQLLLKRG